MKCTDIMSKNLEWLTEKDTVLKAAAIMAEAGVGFLPICDARRRVIGVVTDRDLAIRALTKKVAADSTSATLIMSAPPITYLETTDVRDAENLMAEERKARLVVTDTEGRFVGVLSLSDLVEHASGRDSLKTVRAVLWREALGPRAGAAKGEPLLKDDPIAQNLPPPPDGSTEPSAVFTGGRRDTGIKEFPS